MSQEAPVRHVSELSDPRQRFLARVVDHTLQDHWRTAEDFLRHFPPQEIVASLSSADDLRVKLLVATTGTHEKIALKKSASSATEDLALALAEGTTTPSALVALYPADDKVRHLDAKKLWAFVAEDNFYRTSPDDSARHARAAERLTFILDCALAEDLITLKDVADGMTFDEISASLTEAEVRDVVKHALQIARAGAPLTEERFLAVVPLAQLVGRVRLEHTWDRVVLSRIAAPAGWSASVEPAPPPPPAVVEAKEEEPPPLPASEGVSVAEARPEELPSQELAPGRVSEEDPVRKRAIDRLRLIDRLPPSHADLGTPILLSIESMYADLWAVSDDDEREACIRESFPNETHLRTAMLALIELLDPSVDTRDPIIRDADVSGLIKIVLFEERRRRDAAPASSSKKPQAQASRPRRSVPPPLPRSSTPPPFPAVDAPRSNPPPLPPETTTASKRDR